MTFSTAAEIAIRRRRTHVLARSIALVGFGADSVVDGSVSGVLVWRFRAERTGATRADIVERHAARLVGGMLVVTGVYLALAAVVALANHSGPEHPAVGIALTGASVLVLPVLARAKLRLAKTSDLAGQGEVVPIRAGRPQYGLAGPPWVCDWPAGVAVSPVTQANVSGFGLVARAIRICTSEL